MAEAKYIKQIFAKPTTRKSVAFDLAMSWYYIDEVTREIPRVRGPYPRQTLKKLLDDEVYLFKDGYAWHPSLGKKWMPIERIAEIISPPPTLSDQALQEACMKKLTLQSYPHPHLKGFLDATNKAQIGKKWVIILDRQIAFYPNPLATVPEFIISIEDINEISLILNDRGLAIRLDAGMNQCLLNALKVDEIIEWYHGFNCCRHLVLALGTDAPHLEVDMSELSVCNVKTSDDYVGEKVHDGTLRKMGLKWSRIQTRWFILRTQGLAYYKSKNLKELRKFIKLTPNSRIEWQGESKPANHITLITQERTLKMYADSTYEKEVWVEKLLQTIQNLKVEADNSPLV